MSRKMTRAEAEALATFTTRLRPDWDHPGIVAAISKALDKGGPFDIAHALLTLAEDLQLRSPGLLSSPGRHWTRRDGAATGPLLSMSQSCPDHPEHDHPCPECRAEADALDEDARLAAAADVRAALAAAAKYKPPIHIPKHAATPRDEHLARARARIEQEKRK